MTMWLAFIHLLFFGQGIPLNANGMVHNQGGAPASTLISKVCTALGTDGGTTSPAIDTSGANLLIYSIQGFATIDTASVSDNKSNTFPTGLTEYGTGGSPGSHIRMMYLSSPTVGSGHTFTYAQGATFSSMCVEAWSNMATSSVFDSGTDNGSTTGGSTCQAGSITPSSGVRVIIASVGTTDVSFAIDSSFTVDATAPYGGGGTPYGIGIASLLQVSGTTTNPTWTAANSTGCNIAAFVGS